MDEKTDMRDLSFRASRNFPQRYLRVVATTSVEGRSRGSGAGSLSMEPEGCDVAAAISGCHGSTNSRP